MTTHVRVCIIGGGVLGCSIAYYLARMGCRDVLLLEKTEIGAGSTSQAAGLVGRLRASSLMTKLMRLSVRNLKALKDETGEDPDFHEVGSIRVALTAAREEELRRQVVFGRRHGLDIDFIGPAEARRLVPALDTDGVRVMTYIPDDGFVDPYLLTMAFAKGARQHGVVIRRGVAAEGVLVEDGAVAGVLAGGERIRAQWVVDAAGAWTEQVGEMAGVWVPQFPVRHQLWVTADLEEVRPDQPVVRFPDAYAYIRPEVRGLLIGFFEPASIGVDPRTLARDFEMRFLPKDDRVLTTWAPAVSAQFPALLEAPIVRGCAGLPTFTPDGRFVLGEAPTLKRFVIASGCCAHGIMTAPAVGQLVAELILDGKPSLDLGPLSPGRFGPEYRDRPRLKAACEAVYNAYYGLSPGYR